MKSVYTYKGADWVDLENPTREEIENLRRHYQLSEEVAENLLAPSGRHAVEFVGNHTYIVLHFPAFKDSTDGDAAYELDFVIGDNFVITTRYSRVKTLEDHAGHLEETNLSKMPADPRNVLFFGILRAVLDSFDKKLVDIDHWIRDLEQRIFNGHEKQSIFELSEASRHLIDFKKITAVWPDAFGTLMEKGSERFGPEFAECTAEVITDFERSNSKLETLTEAVRELRETNYSLLSTKQNELMKFLTIFSVIIAAIVGVALVWLGYLAVKH